MNTQQYSVQESTPGTLTKIGLTCKLEDWFFDPVQNIIFGRSVDHLRFAQHTIITLHPQQLIQNGPDLIVVASDAVVLLGKRRDDLALLKEYIHKTNQP